MIKTFLVTIICLMCFSSCFIPPQQAFYLSPRHATSNYYKTMPLVSDALTSATYVSAMATFGGANHRLRDGILSFDANIHQARQWKRLQGFYGAGASAGVYDIKPYNFPGNGVDDFWINERAGSKFQGSGGIYGGMNYVQPFKGGEWRIIGLEANVQKEFGSYYDFRKELPENGANIIERSNWYNSFSVSSDIIGNFSDGSVMGYKIAYSQSFRKLSGRLSNLQETSAYPRFMTHTLHITINKWTGYGQMSFGSDAYNFQVGLSRQISARKKTESR